MRYYDLYSNPKTRRLAHLQGRVRHLRKQDAFKSLEWRIVSAPAASDSPPSTDHSPD